MSTATATHLPDEGPHSTARSVSIGKYRLIARLGTGGMAEVYLAVAQGAMNVNRLVVIKRLRDEQANEPSAREMFLNEARLAARLAHPNVIQTFEAGAEGASYFLAMEYVDGQPLSRLLAALKRDERRLEPTIAARICADALHGLHYAHDLTDFDGSELRIVHRDVSPHNIMLTYDGVVKIVDFGIAKAAGTTQTAHGVFKGKVAFMAPEQVLGDNVDRRADVFAAGIVLWEAVTGKHLMADENPAKTLHNLMNRPIPRASDVCSDVPQALDHIISKALERDLDKRYASAREMRDALETFIALSGGAKSEDVGALVQSFFADTRSKVQSQIKAQLAALSFGKKAEPVVDGSHDVSRTRMRANGATLIDLSDGITVSDPSSGAGYFRVTATGISTPFVPPKPSRTKRAAFAVWVGLTMAAIGVSGLALYRSQRPVINMAPAPPAPAPVAAPATVTATTTATTTSVPTTTSTATTTSAKTESTAGNGAATSAPHAPVWRPAPVYRAPSAPVTQAPAAASPPSPATVDAPRVQSTQPQPAAKPVETGRTFRRDL